MFRTTTLIALIAGISLTGSALATEPGKDAPPGTPSTTTPAKPEPTKPAAKDAPKNEAPTPAKPAETARPQEPFVYIKLETTKGDIYLELDGTKAPISTKNFVQYVEEGHYNGTIFHRVINGFMIQGGGFSADLKQKKTRAPIKNEWQNGLKNTRGTIAMARTPDPDSATSQFYINVADNPSLDQAPTGAAYAVFGKVVAGMDVVDVIKAMPVEQKSMQFQHLPKETVSVTSARVVSGSDVPKG